MLGYKQTGRDESLLTLRGRNRRTNNREPNIKVDAGGRFWQEGCNLYTTLAKSHTAILNIYAHDKKHRNAVESLHTHGSYL